MTPYQYEINGTLCNKTDIKPSKGRSCRKLDSARNNHYRLAEVSTYGSIDINKRIIENPQYTRFLKAHYCLKICNAHMKFEANN